MYDNRYYIFNNDLKYMVIEHNYGTIIYSPLVNLLNKKEELNILDNLVIDLSYTDNYDIIDKYINNDKEDGYIGFYDTKTIYRLKGDKLVQQVAAQVPNNSNLVEDIYDLKGDKNE